MSTLLLTLRLSAPSAPHRTWNSAGAAGCTQPFVRRARRWQPLNPNGPPLESIHSFH